MKKREASPAAIKLKIRGRVKKPYAEVDGKEASRVYIVPQDVKVGPAGQVQMAGIGGVGTEPEFRSRGLARRVYERTMREIKKDRYSCSGLFTGTVIVAHRMYRQFGYVDAAVFHTPMKVVNPKGFVERTISQWARNPALADWRGLMTVHLPPSSPVRLRLDAGKVTAARGQSEADFTLVTSGATFASLSWSGTTPEYAETAGLLKWQGSAEVWGRILKALAAKRPCIHGY